MVYVIGYYSNNNWSVVIMDRDKSLELEMDLMTARRKAEVKNACVHMENKKQFGSPKKVVK